MSTHIYEFLFDDENEAKIWAHGLTVRQVGQILYNPHDVIPNKQGARAPLLLLGRDDGRQCIAVPVEPTYDPEVWRPVTAWPCKIGEETKLRQRGM